MTDAVSIALAQLNPTVGRLEPNLASLRLARKAAAGADLVLTSELFLCGYPPEDLVRKPQFVSEVRRCIESFAPETGDWNTGAVADRFADARAVLVEWAWRERGLIVALDDAATIDGVTALRGRRVIPRQAEAGSQRFLEHLMAEAGLGADDVAFTAPARSENDAALAVLEGKADAAFGLKALASQYRLGFVPVATERFDLLVDRRSWFEPPMQTLLEFCRSAPFHAKAKELQGYDIGTLGRVHFNGA